MIGRVFAPSVTLFMLAFSCAADEVDPAGEAMFGSEQTVSIATGRRQSVRTAPAVATVITAEDIRNYGFRNVAESLSLVPGFHVGLRQELFPHIMVRGFSDTSSSNTLFLLDGVPSREIATGDQLAALGTIPLDMIERIEVTRGPGSSVFGADAFSSVVNIITKRRTLSQQLSFSGGSYDTGNARFLLGTNGDESAVVVGAEVTTTNGWSPFFTEDLASATDKRLGIDSSYAPAHVNSDRQELGAMVNVSFGQTVGMLRLSRWNDFGTGQGLGGSIDPTGSMSHETNHARVAHPIHFSDNITTRLLADFSQHTRILDDIHWIPDSIVFPGGAVLNGESVQTSIRLSADGRYDGLDKHSVAFGAGYEQIRYKIEDIDLNYVVTDLGPLPAIPGLIEPDRPNVDSMRRLAYAYIQDEWLIAPRWNLTLGARFDDYSDVGMQISPRAALVWFPSPEWTAKILYGEGYRAPLLAETHDVGIPLLRGNDELDSQHLRTVDISIEYSPSPRLSLRANVFRHSTVNQIRREDVELPLRPINVGKQVGNGFELEGRWMINDQWSLRAWYAYQYNTDETTGKNAGESPQHRAFASVQYRQNNWFLNLRGSIVGDRARFSEDVNLDEADEYARLDLLGRYELNRNISISLDIRNVLDSKEEEAIAGT